MEENALTNSLLQQFQRSAIFAIAVFPQQLTLPLNHNSLSASELSQKTLHLSTASQSLMKMRIYNMKLNKMSKKILMGSVLPLYSLTLLNGCATMGESTLLGAGIGGSLGTGVGLAAQQSPGSALIGLGIGAAIGAGLGYLTHKDNERKQSVLKAMQGKKKEFPAEPPVLNAPHASCYKQDEKIVGEEYFGPQLRCRIEKNAVWGFK